MRILFLHDNFPAQFGNIGQFLARRGWDVAFGTQRTGMSLDGIKVFNYKPHREVTQKIHPYAANFEKAGLTGQAVARAAIELKKSSFAPDIVMAHSGWGPGLFAKEMWPHAKYVGYFEWYYQVDAPDTSFMNEKPQELDDLLRGRSRNAAILMDLANCDAGICPTRFQHSQFPDCFTDKLRVIHDGIDTDYFSPVEGAKLKIDGLDLSSASEIITYVARGMEPYRGFPEFMKTMEYVLRKRKDAHVVVVGQDRVAYGKKLPDGDSYKKQALAQLDLPEERVHFTGLLPRNQYRDVLRASSVHVYLTVPFVLSWSSMEAMSTGCALVASDVAPVREIADLAPGCIKLADMKDHRDVARAVNEVLDNAEETTRQRQLARELIVKKYAAKDIYAEKERWLTELTSA